MMQKPWLWLVALGLMGAARVDAAPEVPVVPVVVDRESLKRQLEDVSARLARLRGRPEAAALLGELEGAQLQLQILGQLLDSAPVAGAIMLRFPPPSGAAGLPATGTVEPKPAAQARPPDAAAETKTGDTAKPADEHQAIAEAELGQAIKRIDEESLEQEKLRIVRDLAGKHYFEIAQVLRMMPYFSYERTRVKAVVMLAARLLDRENLPRLLETFQIPSSRTKIQKALKR